MSFITDENHLGLLPFVGVGIRWLYIDKNATLSSREHSSFRHGCMFSFCIVYLQNQGIFLKLSFNLKCPPLLCILFSLSFSKCWSMFSSIHWFSSFNISLPSHDLKSVFSNKIFPFQTISISTCIWQYIWYLSSLNAQIIYFIVSSIQKYPNILSIVLMGIYMRLFSSRIYCVLWGWEIFCNQFLCFWIHPKTAIYCGHSELVA